MFFKILQYLIVAFCIVVPVRFFIAQPFVVSGASMTPTFNANEYLVIDEISYRYHKPERGDVIVFRYPLDPSVFFIKRIVGVPGDVIHISKGSVEIIDSNHVRHVLQEPYRAAEINKKDTATTTLASDEYFTLGDNRDASVDSRVWGPLQSRFIMGKAVVRLFPFTKAALLPGQYRFPELTP